MSVSPAQPKCFVTLYFEEATLYLVMEKIKYTDVQLQVLEGAFMRGQYVDREEAERLAAQVGATLRQVVVNILTFEFTLQLKFRSA